MRTFVFVLAVAVLALAACTDDGADPGASRTSDRLRVERIEVDGREVNCVVYAAGHKGGLSCDWTSR